jgi:hypothetical protein
MNNRVEKINAEDVAPLADHSWPGNMRELQNFVKRSVILTMDSVLYVPIEELNRGRSNTKRGMRTLARAEREHILQALQETDWVGGGPHGASTMLGCQAHNAPGQNAPPWYFAAWVLTGACRHFVRGPSIPGFVSHRFTWHRALTASASERYRS